ncbi:hypothetical protein CSQ85_12710 [Bifidobacterium rousetti]|uniref:helix-turn-helix domain-containing protein n=1 Tax=Bifidobacterium rousetti TaxID=2045439 RepID=UPI00123AD608|nr:helix-turn-helix transcriptional regulator [Bifidobacterium rousetti]KAA8815274.1 hypothetical protein CSQ85_12710 [Bifidobacterium rousetti]
MALHAEPFGPGHETAERMMNTVAHLANERGWTVTDLAEKSGIPVELVSRLLDANAAPNLDDLDRFATAFNLDLNDFTRVIHNEATR